jgi:hypothetical protein
MRPNWSIILVTLSSLTELSTNRRSRSAAYYAQSYRVRGADFVENSIFAESAATRSNFLLIVLAGGSLYCYLDPNYLT